MAASEVPGFIPVRQAIDEQRLAGYLKGLGISGFSGDSVRVLQANSGMSNPTYLAWCPADGRGARRLVVRKQPPGDLLPGAHQIEREYRVMRAVRDTKVPVPYCHHFCEDRSVLGTPFYVMDFCEGRVLEDEMLLALPEAHRAKIWDHMNEILAELHRLDFAALGLGQHGKHGGYAKRTLSTWARQLRLGEPQLREHQHKDAATAAAVLQSGPRIEELIRHLEAEVDTIPDCTRLVHGDFRLGNMILHPTEPRVVAVLDWEISTLGHPLLDLAYLSAPLITPTLNHVGPSLTSLPPGVPGERDFLSRYFSRTGVPPCSEKEWKFWRSLDAFRKIAISHGVYARGLAGNAGSSKALEFGQRVILLVAATERLFSSPSKL